MKSSKAQPSSDSEQPRRLDAATAHGRGLHSRFHKGACPTEYGEDCWQLQDIRAIEAEAGAASPSEPLRAALQRIEQKQPEVVERFRREGTVFATDMNKPWDERTDAEKWEHFAFSLYNDIVDIHLQARAALAAPSASSSEPLRTALERLTKAAEMGRRNLQGTTPCYCASSPHEAYCGELMHATAKARAALDAPSRERDPDTDMPWNPEPDPWGKP